MAENGKRTTTRLAPPHRQDRQPELPCDGTTAQTGAHIALDCPIHRHERLRLLGDKNNWEETDSPNMIRVDVNKYEDGVMLFFEYIFDQLT